MRVLLLDYDYSHRRRPYSNLALMKLSAWHKRHGDEVWLNFPLCQPDITYGSCVFTWHRPRNIAPEVKIGGSGFQDYDVTLPDGIEHIMPDYTLYPGMDFSLGFTSRGCSNKCPFCIVHLKEGEVRAHASVREFYELRFRRIVLMDNNLFAAPNWRDTLRELAGLPVVADFNQGLDIRKLDDEKAYMLKQIKTETIRFAFDNITYEPAVRQGIELMLKAGFKPRHLTFYVLVGYTTDDAAIDRIKLLQSYGANVYPMVYRDINGNTSEYKYDFDETIMFNGARGNLKKFLRFVGRLT